MKSIAPNSLARQKKGIQGEGEIKQREGKQELRRQARTLQQVSLGEGC